MVRSRCPLALLPQVTAILLGKVNILNTQAWEQFVFGLNMNWFQLLFKRKITPVVPALGTISERSTELIGALQSSGDRVESGVPELKYQNDYGNNMLTLRRPACQSQRRLELSCKPRSQTRQRYSAFKGISRGGGNRQRMLRYSFGGTLCAPCSLLGCPELRPRGKQHL